MLTTKLLAFTLLGAEWILWLLIFLSAASLLLMIERVVYFMRHRLKGAEELAVRIARGELEAAKVQVNEAPGMEAAVVREGIAAASSGPEAVEEVIAATVARERVRYERGLAFLGTLGNNAPFVGLFGTVLGIIRAFHDLASAAPGAAAKGASTVMAGISEALVATAVGLFVALPAVVAFNSFNRWLKSVTSSTTVLGHALVAHLRSEKKA